MIWWEETNMNIIVFKQSFYKHLSARAQALGMDFPFCVE